MSRKTLKDPKYINRAESESDFTQNSFTGMIMGKNTPNSEIPTSYSERNENINDHGQWSEVRPGTRLFTAATIPDGNLNARCESEKQHKLVWQFGSSLYWTDQLITSFNEIYLISTESPISDAIGQLVSFEDEVYLFNGSTYRIVLDDGDAYAYQINIPVPSVKITDVPETAALTYGYLYIRSYSMMRGDYRGSRVSDPDDTLLVFESGTTKVDGEDIDYGIRFYDSAVGSGQNYSSHIVEELIVDAGLKEPTHHTLYRSKNIGLNSGGRRYTAGQWLGNRTDQLVFVNDISVAEVFNATFYSGTGPGGEDEIDIGLLVGDPSVLRYMGVVFYNEFGQAATVSNTNGSHAPSLRLIVNPGSGWAVGANIAAIGGGRIAQGMVGANSLIGAAHFEATDVGRPIFFDENGGWARIKIVSNANNVILDRDPGVSAGLHSYTLAVADSVVGKTYEFSRKYGDILPDNTATQISITVTPSIDSRIAAENDLFLPRRFFEPFIDCDMGVVDTGFMLVAKRFDNKYEYTQIGDKIFCAGYCRKDLQSKKAKEVITIMEYLNGVLVIFHPKTTGQINMGVSTNAGNKEIGELVSVLNEEGMTDGNIGIWMWQSVQKVSSSTLIALTSEPAVRLFDGLKWDTKDLAVDQSSGLPAVTELIQNYDPHYGCVSLYSQQDGYLLWIYCWVDVDIYNPLICDAIIQDQGGTELTGDDVWQDQGGSAITGDDVIQDVGGDPCS